MNRYTFERDSLGRKISESIQTMADAEMFENMWFNPRFYFYDSIGRLDYQLNGVLPTDTSAKTSQLQYQYFEDKLAYVVGVVFEKDTTHKYLSDIYWYHPESGLIAEILTGWNWGGYWQPHQRELYSYYPNGFIREYKRILKFPQTAIWDHPEEMRRYYYNRTE